MDSKSEYMGRCEEWFLKFHNTGTCEEWILNHRTQEGVRNGF